MDQWSARLRRVPLALVVGGLLLGLWMVRLPGPSGVVCDRMAPSQVVCQATLPRPWAWLPQSSGPLQLQDVTITSDLCDNNPRGGVRFCHRLTLLGQGQALTLPEIRTPLSGAVLTDQIKRFMAGEGASRLSWSGPSQGWPRMTLAIALLLAVATWGLWDLRWPPAPAPWPALDGDTPQPKQSSAPRSEQQG